MWDIKDLRRQIDEGCRFCCPPEKERILCETEHFYVMVSLGPIVEGYLLIVSKEHIGACLHLPDEYMAEFIGLKNRVRRILYSVYGSCLFYEHGKIGTSLVGKDHFHCFHAHMHCIPVEIQLNGIIGREMPGTEEGDFESAVSSARRIERYLYVEDRCLRVYTPQGNIRSQYLRYRLAVALGQEDRWNWIDNQNWPLIYATIQRLKPFFDGKDSEKGDR